MQPIKEEALPQTFTPEQREALFSEIVRLYDFADSMAASMTEHTITNRQTQLEIATPFLTQVTNSANILSAFYAEVVHKNRPITDDLRDTFESAFRNIFLALKEFTDAAEQKTYTTRRRKDMTLNLAEGIAKLESGTLQSRLSLLEQNVPENKGKSLVRIAHFLGDHTAGLVAASLAVGLVVSMEKAMPALGHSSKVVRKGIELTFNPETGEIHKIPILDPDKIKILDDNN